MRSRTAVLLACALVLARGASAGTVPADHEHFQYTGRIDFSNKRAPKISWPGTYIKARFTGTSLKVILADEKGKNSFNVFIDGDYESPHVIRCTQGKSTCDVAKGLAPGEHSVMIFKRTEGGDGVTVFGGLVLDSGAKLLPPPAPPAPPHGGHRRLDKLRPRERGDEQEAGTRGRLQEQLPRLLSRRVHVYAVAIDPAPFETLTRGARGGKKRTHKG
ncbi:MAG: hypothetical protein ACYTKD_19315 [Planctomycetota bacterium]